MFEYFYFLSGTQLLDKLHTLIMLSVVLSFGREGEGGGPIIGPFLGF